MSEDIVHFPVKITCLAYGERFFFPCHHSLKMKAVCEESQNKLSFSCRKLEVCS